MKSWSPLTLQEPGPIINQIIPPIYLTAEMQYGLCNDVCTARTSKSRFLFQINFMLEVILTVHRRYYVEIKCQLDATDYIYCRFYCMLNMFRAILCPSSGAQVMCPVCRLQPANRTNNLQLHTIPTTWKPKHQIPQAATICIILSSSWWWA